MEEITKHTHKIIRSILNPTNSLSKKLAEIILEILIITFAVSLSQFLERQREQNQIEKEVKQFLLGLRKDMIEDRDQAKGNIAEYNNFKISYLYLSKVKTNKNLNADSLNAYVELVKTSTKLIPNVSRFEGFKSSGKLEDITDEPLLQNILYYYEQALPSLSLSQTGWNNLEGRLSQYFLSNSIEYKNGTNNSYELLTKPFAENLTKELIPWPEIYERCNKVIDLGSAIVKEIDTDYPEDR